MKNVSVRIARWSAHHPWRAISGWLFLVALCLGAGLAAGNNSAVSADYRVGEAGRAEAMAAAAGLERPAVEHVLITAADGAELSDPAAESAAEDAAARMSGLAVVSDVSGPIASQDGRALRVTVTLNVEENAASESVADLRAHTEAVQAAHPGLVVEQTGRGSIGQAVAEQRGQDILRVEMITLPITLLTLLLVFRSLSLALVPVILALSSITASIGLSMVVSHVFPDAGVGMNVILLIGMAVGVDYSLFYLKREREERARAGGRLSPTAAVDLAAATSGRAIVLSGLAVAASSATLYLVDDVIFASIATGAVLVTLVAVAGSLTALPAVLAKLGAVADRRAARRERPARSRKDSKVTAGLMRRVGRRPGVALIGSTLVLLTFSAPALGMTISDMGPETHPRELPVMQTFDRLTDAYPDLKAMHQVVVRGDDPAIAEQVRGLEALVLDDPAISGPATVRSAGDSGTQVLELAVPHFVGEPEAQDSLQRLRTEYLPATLGELDGVEYAVSGDVARYADYPQHQQERLPWVIGALLLVTLAVITWAFRSVLLGMIAVLLNLLSAAAAIGVLTWVFQGRWAEGLLDFTSTGTIGSRVPLFLFVILFGLSMDYQVFLVSRIREAVANGATTREAVFEGMRRSASVITGAAVIMVTVFAAFVGVHLIELKQIGFALAVAVLLDAFVVRLLLLPALVLLLGDRVWWPTRVRRHEAATPPELSTSLTSVP